ncbi:MAG: VapC toxin family PIN domain ribonuclease [Actinobacteria bacterium HGW-Actinobacteria-4]|nr:MAG: VapC toxin family PIN domain ribonuclease [Actinobacteria bacterium HGW-Actinobacteria-4]
MIAPDVNLLVYAYRAEMPEHDAAARWLENMGNGRKPLALSSLVVAGYLRLVTNPRIFAQPTPLHEAWGHMRQLRATEVCTMVWPGRRHLDLLEQLSLKYGITGAGLSHAAHAAVAMEWDAVWATADRGFAQFTELMVIYPLDDSAS